MKKAYILLGLLKLSNLSGMIDCRMVECEYRKDENKYVYILNECKRHTFCGEEWIQAIEQNQSVIMATLQYINNEGRIYRAAHQQNISPENIAITRQSPSQAFKILEEKYFQESTNDATDSKQ